MPSPAIEVEHLGKSFEQVAAVSGLDFRIERGSLTALLGGNGAGKTTTIAMLLGLLRPSQGRVCILGHDMASQRYAVLGRMNFSSPYVDLPQRLSVVENLTIYARLYGLRRPRLRIAELARDLDLDGLLARPYGRLSAGQKTRVALAKALLNHPEVLLLDEPTASLDPDTADRIRHYLHGWQREYGACVLLASHNMPEVERLCDRVLMLRRGRLVDQGSPAALIQRHGRRDLEAVFLAVARGATADTP